MKPIISTYTGKSFNIIDPSPDSVCIEDIAHSLSQLCRFTGHTKRFYSVAEHCVRMAEADLPGDSLIRLLHDSAEAYIGDINSPLKHSLLVSLQDDIPGLNAGIYVIEDKLLRVIGFVLLDKPIIFDKNIKEADNAMYEAEVRALMTPNEIYGLSNKDYGIKIPRSGSDHYYWERKFLETYYKLKG